MGNFYLKISLTIDLIYLENIQRRSVIYYIESNSRL